MTQGNPNIEVSITNIHEFHCFQLLLNPKSAPAGELSACCGVPALSSPEGFICVGCAKKCEVVMAGEGRIEIMLHASSLVDLIHKCSVALCEWQAQTSKALILERTGLSEEEARKAGWIA